MYKHLASMLLPLFGFRLNMAEEGGGGEASPESTPEPVEPAPESTADQDSEDKQPEKTFSQAELDEILQKRLAKERRKLQREANLEAENTVLKAQLQQHEPKPQQADGKPSPDKFSTYEDYLDALTDWKIEQRNQKEATERQAKETQTREVDAKKRWQENSDKARTVYSDFDDVIDQDLPLSRPMLTAILDSEVGPDVAYYLGKNPAEAERIARLSDIAAIREIGKIELKLENSQSSQPTKSNAPKPPPSSGSRGQVEKSPGDMSDDEFAKWRLKFIKQR